jgi:hypothetical protein
MAPFFVVATEGLMPPKNAAAARYRFANRATTCHDAEIRGNQTKSWRRVFSC